jgi:SAM-dependent methyltransferase
VTPNPFDAAYQGGSPPWDIGRAQKAFTALADELRGRVLDVGCGTGDLAIDLAERGAEVWGVDASMLALRTAAQRAQARGQLALIDGERPTPSPKPGGPAAALRLFLADALTLGTLRSSFDVIVDCGFFHTLSDRGRERYLGSLGTVARPGTRLYLLCFSDLEPMWGGPRRVRRKELEAVFAREWGVERIEPAVFEHRGNEEGAAGWLMTAEYFGRPAPGVN